VLFAALLLFVLLFAPSCDEVLTDGGDDAASPKTRTTSDVEINRAARGEAGTAGKEKTTAEDDGEELASGRTTKTVATAAKRVVEATFVHRATEKNSRGDYTYLSDPRINGDPNAVVLVAPAPDRGEQASADYGHNVGVWYEPGKKKWAIFNQDLEPVPDGSAFEVVVPPAEEGFIHRAGPADTFGNVTYLDDVLLNGRPDTDVSVTPNWNPGGGDGVYNDHPVGVLYDEDVGKWFVYNEDGARMPRRAAFNVAVSGETG
jgi:hypothetical protein